MSKDYLWTLFTVNLIFGFIGRYISIQKNRNKSEGFLFGFFLSIFGLLIVSLLPTNSSTPNVDFQKTKIKEKVEKKPFDRNRFLIVVLLIIIIISFFYTGFVRGDFK